MEVHILGCSPLLGFRVYRVYRARESRVQGLVRLRVLGLRLEGSISFSKLWGVGVGVEGSTRQAQGCRLHKVKNLLEPIPCILSAALYLSTNLKG